MSRSSINSRRRFLRNAAAGSAVLASGVPLTALAHDDRDEDRHGSLRHHARFEHGVASGDPQAHRVIIWTRVTTALRIPVAVVWEVALDRHFRRVVRRGLVPAMKQQDHTVKVDVTGLMANRSYFYRFSTRGVDSPVGRTRTLPVGAVDQVKLAVFSCSNFPAGYFNVYAEAAKLDDVDVAVHLGDYIYEYAKDGYASADAVALDRVSDPEGELLTLGDYRRRYAQYRSDKDLQAFHAAMPMIAVWDDHEIANDTWKDGAENHDDATEGDFMSRRAAALKAWHEWLPVRTGKSRDRIHRSFSFGKLLDLHMLDTRVIARDKQLDYANYISATGFNAAAFAADMGNPARQLIGTEQMSWLQGQMAASQATWQVLGQQVLMGRMNIPAPLVLGQISFTAYGGLLYKAATAPATLTPTEQFILAQPSVPYNLDAWDGYAIARETLLGTARALNKNLVSLAGDTHNAWASDLADFAGNAVGVEYATHSVSSPGLEEYFPNEDPAAVAAGLTQIIGPLVYAETANRGFMIVTATPEACTAEWRFVSTVKSKDYTSWIGKTLTTLPGVRKLQAV